MKPAKRAAVATLALVIFFGWSAIIVAEPKDPKTPKRESQRQAATAPVYKPPVRGEPGGRVGGGTRGTQERDIAVLSVLAPDHTGLTAKEQPSLFWFISAQTTLPVELTIVDPNADEPLLQIPIPSPVVRGVHRLRLTDYGVRLTRGVAYQWSVAVVTDAARRSRDVLSSGMIERIEADRDLVPGLSEARQEDLVALYAQAGIWYDALEAVCDFIDRSPDDKAARSDRAALLMQAGLPEISE
jgi:hypothetical protein